VPYHVHSRESEPDTGREYATASEAGQSKQPGEIVTFRASTGEIAAWRNREYCRVHNGEYVAPPFLHGLLTDLFPDHYLHLSLTSPGKLAYTKSVQHGIEDRQTIVRPGKYLQEYYPNLSPERIAQYAGMVSAESSTLAIARTPDEIERVYTASHGSCMYIGKSHLRNLPEQPVRAYGNSDLAVAYTGPIADCTSRCVIWPNELIYNRVYGHTSLLEALLKTHGYKRGSIEGARIRAIAHGDGWIVPYIDGVNGGNLDGENDEWITLASGGSIDVQNTSGVAVDTERDRSTCDHCGDPCDADESLCQYCQENTFTCEGCDNRFPDDQYNSANDSGYCDRCYQDNFSHCYHCNETVDNDNVTSVNDRDYCEGCYGDLFTGCDKCGESVPCDDVRSSDVSSETYCTECWGDHDRTCAMLDCETEWNELNAFGYAERNARKQSKTDDLCATCAERFCHTCEETHDPDSCPVIAEAESDGFGVACYDPTGTPWQYGLPLGELLPVASQTSPSPSPDPSPSPEYVPNYRSAWYGGISDRFAYQSPLRILFSDYPGAYTILDTNLPPIMDME